MELKTLLGIKTEVGGALDKFKGEFEVVLMDSAAKLQAYCEDRKGRKREGTGLEELLLIAAEDSTIGLGKEYSIATMAYVNPKIPAQTYADVDMIVEGFEEVNGNFLEKVWQRYHHLPWIIAQTKRCIIRELSLADMDALFELYADGEITKYTEGLYPYQEEKEFQRAYIDNMYRFYGYGMWLVFSRETGELIGRAGLEHREYNGETELELGYVIGSRFRRQGYATEVCLKIMEIAREMTDFSGINCLIAEENEASVCLAEKMGFACTEILDLQGKRMKRYRYDF